MGPGDVPPPQPQRATPGGAESMYMAMGANQQEEEGAYMAIEGQPEQQESVYLSIAAGAPDEEEAMYMTVNAGQPPPDEADEMYMMVDGMPPAASGPSMLGEATGLAAFDDAMNMVEEDMKATAKYYMGSLRGSTLTPEQVQAFQRQRAEKQRLRREGEAKEKAFRAQQTAFNAERERRDKFIKAQANERAAADRQRAAFLERQRKLNLQRDQFLAQQHQQQKRLRNKSAEQAAHEQAIQQRSSFRSPPKGHAGARFQGPSVPPPNARGGGSSARFHGPSVPPPNASGGGGGGDVARNSDAMRQAFLLEQARQKMDDPIVPSLEYVVKAENRQEAEAMLMTTNMSEGCFLVRVKSADTLTQGSMRLKPGQKRPSLSWALSYVTRGGVFSHQLALQENAGGVLAIGGKDIGRCTSVDMLVDHLRDTPGYNLSTTPFHAQVWYHGSIPRQDAEVQLQRLGLAGMFLVRKSLRDSSYVVSVNNLQCVPTHHKIAYDGNAWNLESQPRTRYNLLVDLLRNNKSPNGLKLTRPCVYKKKGINRRR